jgi:hypothetical protein
MIKIKYEYSGKSFDIVPYNTAKEREILLLSLLGVENPVDSALQILGIDDHIISTLNNQEKTAMLYKHRIASIGDEIPIKYICKHCETPNEIGLSIDGIVKPGKETPGVFDKIKPVNEDTLQDFVDVDVDNLDLDEFEKLLNEVKESVTTFEFVRKSNCLKCKNTNYINIENDVIDYMSEDTIMSLYQAYNDLTYFGKYTKQDIDSLYPFERTILIGLLNKTREEMVK